MPTPDALATLVDHSRDHDLTIQGNQAARSRALTHLLELPGMPTVATWSIDAFTTTLVGLIETRRSENVADVRRKLQPWAAFLHSEVAEVTTPGVVTFSAEAVCEYGVRVRISTQFRAAVQEAAA